MSTHSDPVEDDAPGDPNNQSRDPDSSTPTDELIEISVAVDGEAAEAVSELFNRYNGGGWDEDSEAGEAAGGGAVVETTGFDDQIAPDDPLTGARLQVRVKTYLKPGRRGRQIQRQIEEGLWRLGLLYPIPEPQIRSVRQEDWANAWKAFYKPLRVGKRIVLAPAWEEITTEADDIVVRLEPGMAFGTGMHPTTRLCVAALEDRVQRGQRVLDVGTGSGVLAVAAALLGADTVLATDIDTLAVTATADNALRNGLSVDAGDGIESADEPSPPRITVRQGSVPADSAGCYHVIVANILAEILVNLFHGTYGGPLLAEPLHARGEMILSGILEEKVEMVLEAASAHGLHLRQRYQEADWVALVVGRSPA